jgi:hypothetical protein
MSESAHSSSGLTLSAWQRMILQMYGQKDAVRRDTAPFLWLTEEFGELANAKSRLVSALDYSSH